MSQDTRPARLDGPDPRTAAPGPTAGSRSSLTAPRLPRRAPLGVAALAAVLAALLWLLGTAPAGAVALGVLAHVVGLTLWSRLVEGPRAATDRLVTSLVWGAFGAAMVPLVWLLWTAVDRGASTISPEFLTYEMRNVIGDMQGGIYHALLGTLLVTATAAAISVPVGVLTAIYVVEYGRRNRLSRLVTFLVDVMTGIPSIVAGLFALALFVLLVDPAYRSGFAGSVALSLLMIPTVVRSTEEMLRLVPEDLREASYALGVPKWRTIVKVVLPTAFGGIVTGVVLAISRVIGETAPLLIVAGVADSVNTDVFSERMQTLPVFIFNQYSLATDKGRAYAWGGALVLVVLVMLLNLAARVVGRIFAPAKG